MDPSKDRPPTVGNLNTDDWKRFEEIADRFEQAWRQAAAPTERVEIASFLPPPENPLRSGVLHELIKIDLEVRCRRGQTVRLEEYVQQYPELGPAARLPASLVYEEYRVRQLYGDKPEVGGYRERFPERFAELERLVASQPLPTMTHNQQTPAATPAAGDEHGRHKPATPVGTMGDYKLVKRIGTGGFGEVWRAEAPGGVEVAIKIIFRPLDHEEAQRELQSLELVKQLRHPFLLQTQAFYQHEDKLRIVMELADGSLRDRLKECRKDGLTGIPLAELLTYFREAAEALDYLHSEHVLHRDIKPENILLLKRHAKVADFGLARLQQNQRSVSASGSGTPAYMAPEVWRGKVSVHSDQYSLAAAYVELRLDRRPFPAGDMMELMFSHLERGPDLSGLPEPERQVVLKAMTKDPNQRYGSCSALVQALDRAAVGGTDQASATAATEPDQTPRPGPCKPVGDTGWETLGKGDLPSEVAAARSASSTDVEPGVAPAANAAPNWRGGAETLPRAGVPAAKRPSRRRFLAAAVLLGIGLPVGGVVAYQLLRPEPDAGPIREDHTERRPEVKADYVPLGCVPAEGAELFDDHSRKLYSKVEYRTKGGKVVQFVLILKKGPGEPPTFYMMENKAWVALYREYAQDPEHQQYISNKNWDMRDKGLPWLNQRDRLPVLNVPATDAYFFARWLRGTLPNVLQWNKAAGFFEDNRGEGPFRGSWDTRPKPRIAVGRGDLGPEDVGTAADDISRLGVRDMAGNGREWTRTFLLGDLSPHELPKVLTDDLLLLRGHDFFNGRPWRFQDIEKVALRNQESAPPTKPSATTSFRVVLELPE
jgi:hypothetical protein